MKNIHIFGGGTMAHIASHLALTAPAYGTTAKTLKDLCLFRFTPPTKTYLELTKMAGGSLETNNNVFNRIEDLKKNLNTKIIFFSCALVDWEPVVLHKFDEGNTRTPTTEIGKYVSRLESRLKKIEIECTVSEKIISNIRKGRKDIFLVGFKTTCGATKQEMFEKGLRLCKQGSVNLVLVNDVETRWNMIVTPEEAAYHETTDREDVLRELVDMTFYRSQLTFTQSTVVEGKPVNWNDERIPASLRTVVDYCIKGNAYKPFHDSTVGHFAIKLSDTEFLTSIRRSNFNKLAETGMVYVKTDGPDTVLAYGAKPSVGGQSQRIVFREHPGMDCIVHFHSPLKENHRDNIPVKSQREVECGSHQCGKQTSDGLKEFGQFGNLKAVYLDQHGPNIVFNKNIDPQEVINFIESNFDLSKKTGGYNL